MEVCAGKKLPFPQVPQYKRVQTRSEGKISFRADGFETNRLGLMESEFDFYIGGTDSCQGECRVTTEAEL